MKESIGQGSFSQVFKAQSKKTNQIYAAKIASKKDKNKASTKTLI